MAKLVIIRSLTISPRKRASLRTIRRDAERGQQVCKDALDVLRGTKADTGTVLDALKDLPPEQQVVAAYREAQKRQAP